MKESINKYLGFPLLVAILISVCFIPSLNLFNFSFNVTLQDLLLPLVVCFLAFKSKETFVPLKKLSILLLIFVAYVLFTIVINGRIGVLSDHFEIYKIIKGLLFLVFAFVVFDYQKLKPYLRVVLFLLIVFNTLHFFDVFNFNSTIETFYASDIHLKYFGLNSLGEQSSKRILGTLGNPNNNAILFLFLACYFFPNSTSTKIDRILFVAAVSFATLCQSRTGFIALTLIMIFALIFNFQKVKTNKYTVIAAILVGFSMLFIADLSYLNKAPNLKVRAPIADVLKIDEDGNEYIVPGSDWVMNSESLNGRYKVWKHLLQSFTEKPIFGYGPNKEYFYERKMYPEGTYVLWLWRYGTVGFLFLIGILLYIFVHLFKNRNTDLVNVALLFFIVVAITSITNIPLSHPRLSALFFIIVGAAFKPVKLK